jgi:predicted kinase
LVVVSGAPGTGKTTVAEALSRDLGLPLLSLDQIKEALADSLGLGEETWSDRLGDAAAEVVFRLAKTYGSAVAEGWWRRERRDRAMAEFRGAVEVFCRCDGAIAEARMRERRAAGRHPIHRDVINPTLLDGFAAVCDAVTPLGLGGVLIEVDTTATFDTARVVSDVRAAAGST